MMQYKKIKSIIILLAAVFSFNVSKSYAEDMTDKTVIPFTKSNLNAQNKDIQGVFEDKNVTDNLKSEDSLIVQEGAQLPSASSTVVEGSKRQNHLNLTRYMAPMPSKQMPTNEVKEVYLSDLTPVSATHGDVDKNKTVQKNRPFSTGNNGIDRPISLQMEDGTVVEFDKGIGTVAGNPSVIHYSLGHEFAKRLSTFIGIDRSANHPNANYAHVDRVDIKVDGQVIYSTLDTHPDGINYDTKAIKVDLALPEYAQSLELISYAGDYTWGDEVVFADAKLEVLNNVTFLSDNEWLSAEHGDALASKTVQKNKPFTSGNQGQNKRISILTPDKQIKEFEKGLGTIAGGPSVITYDITGADVSRFMSLVGIDRTAQPIDSRYAHVQKIEVLADDVVLYSSIDSHKNGIDYDTPAFLVDVRIPEGTKLLQLKSYAGDYTWGDELVYAGALLVASNQLKNPNDFVPAPKRRHISNKAPLLMMPLYANGGEYNRGNYKFWGDDTLYGKWESIPEDMKPYVVLQLHPDDLPKRAGVTADFYEHMLEMASQYINPKTGKKEPIPIVLTVYTAGNVPQYTSTHWLAPTWIDKMYTKYVNLQGLFSTENYWIWISDVESAAASYLKLSAKHGGYFIWSEQNNNGSIEKAMGTRGKTIFKETVEKYWENFVFMFKNTPAAEGNDAPTVSYMSGLWLADYAYQWGGLMDTWKWYETGKWKLFASGNIGKSQGNRQWLTEPEAMLGEQAMMIYLNGGTVYNFEHPFYTYGVRDLPSPLFINVISEFFRYIIANPAPSKEEMLAKTKLILHGNFSSHHNGHYFVGIHTRTNQTPLYTTGRYGVIPAIPSTIDVSKLKEKLGGIQILGMNSPNLAAKEQRKNVLDMLYPKEYEGDIFAQKLFDKWFIYNYNDNVNEVQSGQFGLGQGILKVSIEPHTYLIVSPQGNQTNIILNNFRTNKDSLWQGTNNPSEARRLPNMSKIDAENWVYNHYIHNTPLGELRTSVLVVQNVTSQPTVTVHAGTDESYEEPKVTFDSTTKTATIVVKNNGYLNFTINH